ncbi:MAG: hypothetical protein R3F51_00440 [Cyanobacteriota/Melainabacteria group bacterium]
MKTETTRQNKKLLLYLTLFGFAAYAGLFLLRILTVYGEWRRKAG